MVQSNPCDQIDFSPNVGLNSCKGGIVYKSLDHNSLKYVQTFRMVKNYKLYSD
jgi:hypothetical protein